MEIGNLEKKKSNSDRRGRHRHKSSSNFEGDEQAFREWRWVGRVRAQIVGHGTKLVSRRPGLSWGQGICDICLHLGECALCVCST